MNLNLADYSHAAGFRRTVTAIAPIACPPEIEALGLVDAVVDHLELSMRALPEVVRVGLIAGVTGYELASMAWPGHWGRPASKLNRDQAIRYFNGWHKSPIRLQREFIKGIKGLLCMGYFSLPEVKELIGYTPDAWVDQVKRKRLATYGDDIRRHEESILAADPLPSTMTTSTSTENPEEAS